MGSESALDRLHRRYLEQASWTRDLRERFLPPRGLGPGMHVLEVGAGTGAVVGPLAKEASGATFHALDLDPEAARAGAALFPDLRWQIGDAHALPLAAGIFDAAFFHFVLLWLSDPGVALLEAVRVTRPGGVIAAFAEPDHAGRIDFPNELAAWGRRQTAALATDGADVGLGRRLRSLFAVAGLEAVTSGIIGAEWRATEGPSGSRLEREVMHADLTGSVPEADLDQWERLDRDAWARGERVLFVPTFYAVGRVPIPGPAR